MPKLHEVVAIEGGLQTVARDANNEAIKTFGKKDEHFIGRVRAISHFAEEDTKLDTVEESELVTTVPDKLLYLKWPNVRALDAYLQKESANQEAKADIEIDGHTLVAGVPATVLLGLETKLVEFRKVIEVIPTLAPGQDWQEDFTKRAQGGVYYGQHEDVTFRTKRILKPIIMAPATKEHPAQVQAVQEDTPVAKIITRHWSGMMSSADKSQLLERADRLIRAVKRARQRANMTEAPKKHIGQDLIEFIFGTIVK